MKTLYVVLTILMLSQLSFGAIPKETKYVTQFKAEKFTLNVKSENSSDHIKEFAQNCFNHFTGGGRVLSHDEGIDMINACTNPKLTQ